MFFNYKYHNIMYSFLALTIAASKHIMSINPIMSIFLSFLALLFSLYFLHASLCSKRDPAANGGTLIKGSIVLMKKRVLDLTDLRSSIVDRIYELFGRGVSFQLVSATAVDSTDDKVKGKLGEPAYLEGWIRKLTSFNAGDARYSITFNWNKDQGIPGAIIVKNHHRYEFLLKTLTLEDVPGKGRIHFVCNSWVYPVNKYSYDRIFFANDTYLPSNTPEPLRAYREDELRNLQGSGMETRLQEHDRIYDYDSYNDLGDEDNKRPVLGGSKSPYPRRGKTGVPGVKGDYLPRDEYFRHLKSSDFFAYLFKSGIKTWILSRGGDEFHSFKDVKKLYGKIWFSGLISWLAYWIPFEFIREILRTDGEPLIKFPIPQVIKNDDDKTAWWETDKEFARQMLAGLNPVLLRVAKDKEIHDFYDNKREKCMEQKVKVHYVGKGNDRRFFVLDHSYIKEYQNDIYASTKTRVSASKTILYLEEDGTLTPEGILLIDKTEDGQYKEKYYFPANDGIKGGLWKLAKAFVVVNDSGYHQLVSHWLNTHAVIEPFVIATHRRLSVMHPIHKLLSPHFRDTMNMNNLARHKLVNANGIIEKTFFPGSFAMKMTSDIYSNWNLMDHALPADLIRRGVAVKVDKDEDIEEENKDKDGKRNIRLLIKDYPYAVDGLEVWSEIERWVSNYCSIYYDDTAVQADTELQEWWTEVREKGHGDLKDKQWWPTMQSKKDLIECCTIVIWLASAFHAAVNFGQYAYAGYVPNRPTFIRNPMPLTVEEEKDMEKDPEGYFLKTITGKPQALEIMSVIQILSRHSSEEIYLGQRDDEPMWTSDQKARVAFNEFQSRLKEIVEVNIENRNWDESLKNRHGEVKIPYTLLYPNTSGKCVPGVDGKGIPNSVSI